MPIASILKGSILVAQNAWLALTLRFLTSGGLATTAHWLSMWLLIRQGLDATLATASGAGIGAVINYLLQYYHTFRCQAAHGRVILAYLQTVLAGWVANIVLFYSLFNFFLHNAVWAQFFTTALVTSLNFYLYHKVVFHERGDS